MKIDNKDYQSVWFEEGQLKMIDQNKLPFEFEIKAFAEHVEVMEAIRVMTVRGAPAIGVAGAYGMALAAKNADESGFRATLRKAHEELCSCRPTAIDLRSGVDHVYESTIKFIPNLEHARRVALLAAEEFAERVVNECYRIGQVGAALITPGARILTHCNAGALATVDHGTALAVIRAAFAKNPDLFVYVDETRPRLQGARLTAWELQQEGIPHAIIADSAAGYYFSQGEIDIVITGADRICTNGDIANKIGTYEKAVLAKVHEVPFYIAAPISTFDLYCPKGSDIPIEFRDPEEITEFEGVKLANLGSPALNPAFDITPAEYIDGIITPCGVFEAKDAARKLGESV